MNPSYDKSLIFCINLSTNITLFFLVEIPVKLLVSSVKPENNVIYEQSIIYITIQEILIANLKINIKTDLRAPLSCPICAIFFLKKYIIFSSKILYVNVGYIGDGSRTAPPPPKAPQLALFFSSPAEKSNP